MISTAKPSASSMLSVCDGRLAIGFILRRGRSDVEGFIPREIVEACVGRYYALPYQSNFHYRCFIDTASGVPDGDSYAIVIATQGDRSAVGRQARAARAELERARR